jgi:hypothetical protein
MESNFSKLDSGWIQLFETQQLRVSRSVTKLKNLLTAKNTETFYLFSRNIPDIKKMYNASLSATHFEVFVARLSTHDLEGLNIVQKI